MQIFLSWKYQITIRMKNYNLKLLVTFPIKKAPHLHGVTKQALFRRTVLHQAQAVKRTEKDIKT